MRRIARRVLSFAAAPLLGAGAALLLLAAPVLVAQSAPVAIRGSGNPVYDWTVVDGIFETWVKLGIKPLVEIEFMPEALSSRPDPYRHFWKPGDPYGDIYTGRAYRPEDYRKLATNGVDRRVLDGFRMLGKMGRREWGVVESAGALTLDEVLEGGVRGSPDTGALATRDTSTVAVLVWNYHDDDPSAPDAEVVVTLGGLPEGRPILTHRRIDPEHSHAYARWLAMGSPQAPTPAPAAELEAAGKLETLLTPSPITIIEGRAVLPFRLPRQGVSLLTLTWPVADGGP